MHEGIPVRIAQGDETELGCRVHDKVFRHSADMRHC